MGVRWFSAFFLLVAKDLTFFSDQASSGGWGKPPSVFGFELLHHLGGGDYGDYGGGGV